MDVFVRGLNALLMIALPLLLGVALARRLRVGWDLFGIGAATFFASQLLHLPFNAWVLDPGVERLGLSEAARGWPLIAVGVLYGLSAGVFEEGARALVYRTWLRRARTWAEGLMFGAGHGGLEAIILGGLSAYGLLQALALQGVDLGSVVPAGQVETAQAQLQAYWSAPWTLALLGAVERAFAVCLHLGLSILVLQAFRRGQVRWWLAAVIWHTLADAAAVVTVAIAGPYWAEAVVGLMAMASVGIVISLREGRTPADSVPAPQPPPGALPPAPDLSPRQLDDSRFSG
jgi:uncharacterized membrane protein YhfC